MISNELVAKLKLGEKEAFEELVSIAVQEALRMLPIVNENIVKRGAALHSMSEKFYVDNPELVSHKPMVASTIERIEGENPGMGFDEILKRAAPETRTAIGCEKKANAFKPSEGSRLEQLDDMIGAL